MTAETNWTSTDFSIFPSNDSNHNYLLIGNSILLQFKLRMRSGMLKYRDEIFHWSLIKKGILLQTSGKRQWISGHNTLDRLSARALSLSGSSSGVVSVPTLKWALCGPAQRPSSPSSTIPCLWHCLCWSSRSSCLGVLPWRKRENATWKRETHTHTHTHSKSIRKMI